MKNTQNVKLLSVFEWAKIISEKFWDKVAISFISQTNPMLTGSKAFAPACYFDMTSAKEDEDFWKEVSEYAMGIVGNTTENIYKEVINPTLEELGKIIKSASIKVKKEPTKEEQECEDKLQALMDCPEWIEAIKEMADAAWVSEKKMIKLIKKDFRKSPKPFQERIEEITELLNKSNSIWRKK